MQTPDDTGSIGNPNGHLVVSRAEKIVVVLDVACLVVSITK